MKRITLSLLMIFMTFTLVCTSTAYAKDVGVEIDGVDVVFTQDSGKPFVDNSNRTQVPLRLTMESAGCLVTWDDLNKMAIIKQGTVTVKVPIGKSYILVNEVKQKQRYCCDHKRQ